MSLRERKKLATRTALITTARKLFAEKGYENTTLEEICDAVQIHVKTFFSYFESKEELAFARMIATFNTFRDQLRDRPKDVDVLTFWWKFLDDFGLRGREEESVLVARMDSVPALRSRHESIVRQYVDVIAHALAEESGHDPDDDLYDYLFASILMSAHVSAARWYTERYSGRDWPIDTTIFSKLVLSRFPPRDQIEAALDVIRSASGGRGNRHRGTSSTEEKKKTSRKRSKV